MNLLTFKQAYALVASIEEAAYLLQEGRMPTLRVIGNTPYSNALRMGVRKDDAILPSIIQKGVDFLTQAQVGHC